MATVPAQTRAPRRAGWWAVAIGREGHASSTRPPRRDEGAQHASVWAGDRPLTNARAPAAPARSLSKVARCDSGSWRSRNGEGDGIKLDAEPWRRVACPVPRPKGSRAVAIRRGRRHFIAWRRRARSAPDDALVRQSVWKAATLVIRHRDVAGAPAILEPRCSDPRRGSRDRGDRVRLRICLGVLHEEVGFRAAAGVRAGPRACRGNSQAPARPDDSPRQGG